MAVNMLNLLYTQLKLPEGVLSENVENIEVKITTKEGDELSGQLRLADCHSDRHDQDRHESKTLCVELSTLCIVVILGKVVLSVWQAISACMSGQKWVYPEMTFGLSHQWYCMSLVTVLASYQDEAFQS